MKCCARTADGGRCGADAMRGGRTCFWHSRATRRQAREARRRGGQARALALRPALELDTKPATLARQDEPRPPPVPWAALRSDGEVLDGVRDVTRAVLARRLDPRAANTALLGLQALLNDGKEKRRWAADQLRDRTEQLVSDVDELVCCTQGHPLNNELHRLANLIEYIADLVRKVT